MESCNAWRRSSILIPSTRTNQFGVQLGVLACLLGSKNSLEQLQFSGLLLGQALHRLPAAHPQPSSRRHRLHSEDSPRLSPPQHVRGEKISLSSKPPPPPPPPLGLYTPSLSGKPWRLLRRCANLRSTAWRRSLNCSLNMSLNAPISALCRSLKMSSVSALCHATFACAAVDPPPRGRSVVGNGHEFTLVAKHPLLGFLLRDLVGRPHFFRLPRTECRF